MESGPGLFYYELSASFFYLSLHICYYYCTAQTPKHLLVPMENVGNNATSQVQWVIVIVGNDTEMKINKYSVFLFHLIVCIYFIPTLRMHECMAGRCERSDKNICNI